MDVQSIAEFILSNLMYIVGAMGVLIVIMYVIIIHLWMDLSYMKRRYRKMMTGVDGANLERMLIGHIDETKRIAEENQEIKETSRRMDALLQTALTRVGIVRFAAFEDMGSDLSFAVALLDAHDNGVVLSSIFGREESRSYAKPILDGKSTYTLTDEEQKVLKDAMAKGKKGGE